MKEGGEPGTFYHVSDVTGAVVRKSRRARVEWKHAPSARSRDYLASVSPIA